MVHQQFSVFFKVENICRGVSICRGSVLRRRGMCQNLSVRAAHTLTCAYELSFFLFFFKLVWKTKDLQKQLE